MWALLTLSFASAARFLQVQEPVPDSFIVVFKEGLSANAMKAHKKFATENGVIIERHFAMDGGFHGYGAHMSKDAVGLMLQSEEVSYIEEDGVVTINHDDTVKEACETQTETGPWGLVRTSQRLLKPDGNYYYPTSADGTGVTVYVIDTGVLITHEEFQTSSGSRAKWGINTVDAKPPVPDTDGNGHGTHCAGTIGGNKFGMAKKANIIAVKVLNNAGSGTIQSVVAGVQWAVEAAKKDPGASVGSMSLGGSKSQAMNDAVDAAARDPTHPFPIVVAAGNSNADAANFSPASAAAAITVAASDSADKKASFSNYGRVCSIWAPGVSILSAWIPGNTATNTISGTSMACPHVAGQVAKFLQHNGRATPAEIKAWLQSVATPDMITNGGLAGTPNLLLFADCDTFSGLVNSTVKLAKRY